MMFDKLCGVIENHFKEIRPILEGAKLFEFPYIPHKVLPKTLGSSDEESIWAIDNFFLPFPIIAIEDKASCIVLWDTIANQKGLKEPRGFLEFLPFREDTGFFIDSDASYMQELRSNPVLQEYHRKDFGIVTLGTIYDLKLLDSNQFFGKGDIIRAFLGNKNYIKYDNLQKKERTDKFPPVSDSKLRGPLINAYSAIQEVVYFNQPTKFVLETTNLKSKKPKNRNKILRSHERPIYTILEPNAIREKLHLPKVASNKKSPIPHDRRRHDRWLSDIIYSKDSLGNPIPAKIIPWGPRKGQPYYKHTIVPDSWVGPKEAVFKNKLYKVILDI